MPQRENHSQSSRSVVPTILFGIDEHGKPKAARFVEKHAPLAVKAAAQLQLQVLAITDPRVAEICCSAAGWSDSYQRSGAGAVCPTRPL
jgi:hypothetical protein